MNTELIRKRREASENPIEENGIFSVGRSGVGAVSGRSSISVILYRTFHGGRMK